MSWRNKSYEFLPALSIRGRHLRRALRITTMAWMLGVVWMACIAGSRLTIFCRMIGFNDFHFGLLSAVPFAATFGQLFAVMLIERTGLRKYQFLYCAFLHRAMWVPIALIPLVLPIPSPWAVWTMLAILLVSWFLSALAMPAWFTWMGDLIPRRIRGRYFATHKAYAELVKIPVVIALGLTLDYLTRTDPVTGHRLAVAATTQPVLLWGICAVFVLAAALGCADILCFRWIPEVFPSIGGEPPQPAAAAAQADPQAGVPLTARVRHKARDLADACRYLLAEPLKDRVFRRYVLFGATVSFGIAVGGPYFWRVLLELMGFSQFATDSLFLMLGPLAGVVSAKGWGRLIDRWGRRPTLCLATACTVYSITPYFFASPNLPSPGVVVDAVNGLSGLIGGWIGQPQWQWLSADMPISAWLLIASSMIVGGSGWAGLILAQRSIILGFADGHGRSKYVAAHGVLISTGGMIGGLVGGTVAGSLAFLQSEPIRLGPLVWNNWHATFALSLLARLAALVSLINMPDPGAGSFRNMVRYIGGNVYNQAATFIFYPLRVFGWGRGRGPNQDPRG